jgi:O-methyltransferase
VEKMIPPTKLKMVGAHYLKFLRNKKFFHQLVGILRKFRKAQIYIFKFIEFIIVFAKCNPRKIRLILKVKSHTMVSFGKLVTLYNFADAIVKNKVEGDLVECGCWKGGASAILGYIGLQENRKLWLFDSFQGLPNPTAIDGLRTKEMFLEGKINKCIGSVRDVQEIMKKLKIDMEKIVIRKGWFQDTLPTAKDEIERIAMLHIDADWYSSVKTVLENLYDRVVKNGVIAIDDYGPWEGCKKAVDEFLTVRKVQVKGKLVQGGFYFRKPF